MSQYDNNKAAALRYEGGGKAPVVVASGSGYIAEKIIEIAEKNDVPVYKDNSIVSLLANFKCGDEVPQELYEAIVKIYLYFLKYDFGGSSEKPSEIPNTENNTAEG